MLLDRAIQVRDQVLSLLSRVQWLAPLVARISAGVLFAQTGWGKLNNIDKVVAFFTELGIPAPEFQARLVGTLELSCGTLILLGLMTRLASVPLAVIMVVALATAKSDEIAALSDLFGIYEYLYIVLFLYLIVQGAGALSLDHWLLKRLEKRPARRPARR